MSDHKQIDLSPVDFRKPPQPREWRVEITHWGENGKPNQREEKIIMATGASDALAQAKGWANVRQNETGKPWKVTDIDHYRPTSEPTTEPFPGYKEGRATKILRLTLADGTWLERELPEDWDNESACHYILNNLPDGTAAPVGLRQPLFAGSADAYDLDDALERALEGRAARHDAPQTARSDSQEGSRLIEAIICPTQPTRRQKTIFFGSIITALVAAIVGFATFFITGAAPWQVAVKLIVVTPVAFAIIGIALIGAALRAGDMIACENYYAQIATDWVKNLRETLAEDQEENNGKETEG